MISDKDIRLFFRNILINAGVLPNADIAWEERSFSPEGKDLWMEESLIPINSGVSTSVDEVALGIVQYAFLVPRTSGTAALDDITKAVGDLYNPGKIVEQISGALNVTVDKTEVAPSSNREPNWRQKPVRISYRIYENIT